MRTRLCLIGDSSSVHLARWAEHFARENEVMVISDTSGTIPGVRVERVFEMGTGLRNLTKVFRMRRLVREFGPNVVHGHYLTVGGVYAALSGGRRIVGSAWGSDVYQDPVRSFTKRFVLKRVLRKCDLVFAGSGDAAAAVRGLGFSGTLPIVRFGVDPERFKRSSRHGTGEFRVLSPRYCSRIYNPLVIIEAFRSVLPVIGNAYLHLVEHGNMLGEVRQKVESDAMLRDHVRFFERRPYESMPELYNSADLAISIPDSDSVAATVLECMACELPVVASDIPNMRELIDHGRSGFLTRIEPEAVAKALLEAHAAGDRLQEVGRRAREKVLDPASNLTWESNMRVAESAYRRLLIPSRAERA